MAHPLAQKYAEIVDDVLAFEESLRTPLPGAFWINAQKCDALAVARNLVNHGINGTPIPWHPHAHRVSATESPAKSLAYLAGGLYVQEEVAMTAAIALGVEAGDTVLDMCAAPGGKTCQMALAAGPLGRIFANESNRGRLSALGANLSRLGLTNCVSLRGDGRAVPMPYGSLDRVMCDVPCSGEGTARKSGSDWEKPDSEFKTALPAIQGQLLRRALHQTRPGGYLVYSTCTFSPDENECVLDATLDGLGEVIPFSIPGFRASPGVEKWRGRPLRSDVRHAARFWPHMNDCGGFFVALIRRTEEPTRKRERPRGGEGEKSWSVERLPAAALDPLRQRFGLAPDVLEEHILWSKGNGKVWLGAPNALPHPGMDPESVGFVGLKQSERGPWATSYFLQWLGEKVTRNFVELDFAQGMDWARGLAVTLGPNPRSCAVDGQVQVRCEGLTLGHGKLEGEVLHSQVPKGLKLV